MVSKMAWSSGSSEPGELLTLKEYAELEGEKKIAPAIE